MLINGQHGVEASTRLQDIANCSDKRKNNLLFWDAYIV
jgi:hypothetical protein